MKIINYRKNKSGQDYIYFNDTVIKGEIQLSRDLFIKWIELQLLNTEIPNNSIGSGKYPYYSRYMLKDDTKDVLSDVKYKICNIRVSFTSKLVKDLQIDGNYKQQNYIIYLK